MIADWWVRPGLFIVLVIAIGLLGTAIQRLLAKKTVANWMGTGVNEDLAPHEAALLLAFHPSAIIAILFIELQMAGKTRLLDENPFRAEWARGSPAGAAEEAFAAALDEEGGLNEEGVCTILEAIYERVNSQMVGYGGRVTAVYYRELAGRLLEEFLEESTESATAVPWLLLANSDARWGEIGEGAVDRQLKSACRLRNLMEQWLLPRAVYVERSRKAKLGFFRYRKDLQKLERSVPFGPLMGSITGSG